MPKPFTPKVVTASDLIEGDVIYQTTNDGWSRALKDAEILTDEEAAQARLSHAERQVDRLVGAYLADVRAGENGAEPVHFREEFRRTGPSNYAHGKQETQAITA